MTNEELKKLAEQELTKAHIWKVGEKPLAIDLAKGVLRLLEDIERLRNAIIGYAERLEHYENEEQK